MQESHEISDPIGDVCLDISPLYGPRVVESGQEASVELSCSFSHNASELNQLDVKCYFQVQFYQLRKFFRKFRDFSADVYQSL
jgi:hypothetical protein